MRLSDWPYWVMVIAFVTALAVLFFRLPWILLLLAAVALAALGVLIVTNYKGLAAYIAQRNLGDGKDTDLIEQLGESFFTTQGVRGFGVYFTLGGLVFAGFAFISSHVSILDEVGKLLVPICAFSGVAWFLLGFFLGGRTSAK